mmetsp:Transcript_90585/g.161337  ORF Transcript_90585/g.161337 Transcript_90585/m.161337 type:complete len:96 (+) Transcript_90585:34-321(+)
MLTSGLDEQRIPTPWPQDGDDPIQENNAGFLTSVISALGLSEATEAITDFTERYLACSCGNDKRFRKCGPDSCGPRIKPRTETGAPASAAPYREL